MLKREPRFLKLPGLFATAAVMALVTVAIKVAVIDRMVLGPLAQAKLRAICEAEPQCKGVLVANVNRSGRLVQAVGVDVLPTADQAVRQRLRTSVLALAGEERENFELAVQPMAKGGK